MGKYIDLTGQKFNRLTVVEELPNRKVKCKCDCGTVKTIRKGELKNGAIKSCGCLSKELAVKHFNENMGIINGTSIKVIKFITNGGLRTDNKSGVTGVYFRKREKLWFSCIMFQHKSYRLGYFKDKELAVKARKQAEENLFGNFLEWYEQQIKTLGQTKNEIGG